MHNIRIHMHNKSSLQTTETFKNQKKYPYGDNRIYILEICTIL